MPLLLEFVIPGPPVSYQTSDKTNLKAWQAKVRAAAAKCLDDLLALLTCPARENCGAYLAAVRALEEADRAFGACCPDRTPTGTGSDRRQLPALGRIGIDEQE